MTGLTALILMTVALPPLLARLAGGYPPSPSPELAALAPLAVVPAIAAVIIAACAAWWLAALLAIPAALLLIWQLPRSSGLVPELRRDHRTERDLPRPRSGYACSP